MEERFLMKWFRNPFKPPVWYGIQKKWWSLAAPQLMRELKQLGDISKKDWDEYERLNDRIEELEDKNAELNRKNMLNQNGYWRIQSTENSTSCYRLDEKFIEWYKVWREPVQMKLEFEYERRRTKEEEKRYDAIYGGLIE